MTCVKFKGGIICTSPTFKPGDLPPEGYLAWHEWAEVQRKAGIKQVQCARCGLWQTPQELSDQTDTYEGKDKKGNLVTITEPVCTKCINSQGEPHGRRRPIRE